MLFASGVDMPEGVEGAIAAPDRMWWRRNELFRIAKIIMNRLHFPGLDSSSMDWRLYEVSCKLPKRMYLHHPFSNFKSLAKHPLVRWADIIHLHWVPEFVDYPTFFREINKPIVWTCHDMLPALGVMHFESEYTKCPDVLRSMEMQCRKIRRKGIEGADITFVGLSEMMCEILKSSEVTQEFPCRMIHNGVDVKLFDRRRVFSPDVTTFLFSSYGIHDERKGLCRIVEALESLETNDIQLWCLGNNFDGKELPKASFPIKHLGNIVDQEFLSTIYSSADFFINASYEEAFAQTPLESMACGTPVISTPCSGAKDLIRDFNGVVCKGFSPSDLKDGMQVALSRRYDHREIRKYIVENFSSEKIAKQYIELYGEIIEGSKQVR